MPGRPGVGSEAEGPGLSRPGLVGIVRGGGHRVDHRAAVAPHLIVIVVVVDVIVVVVVIAIDRTVGGAVSDRVVIVVDNDTARGQAQSEQQKQGANGFHGLGGWGRELRRICFGRSHLLAAAQPVLHE
jgi:hypothetical protein